MKLKLKVYRGFASNSRLYISGHVFKKYDPSSFNLEQNWLRYAYSMWRTFSIKTMSSIPLTLHFQSIECTVRTNEKGFFNFQIDHDLKLSAGWHEFSVTLTHDGIELLVKGELLKAADGYGIISDIDDTFLISHSTNTLKKIYILLTRNINKRKFFKGVVQHYRQLARVDQPGTQPALFFCVSSSEWNLYNFIEKFTLLHQFPKAVFFLKTIKNGVFDLLSSGSGLHDKKYDDIKYLFRFYPERKFILMGDDTQQDPFIYYALAKEFTDQIIAIYIRQVSKQPKLDVQDLLLKLDHSEIVIFYFNDSDVAIAHSVEHGLV